MKKFLFILCAVLAIACTASCTSCTNEDGDSFGFVYALESNGSTDGFVTVGFPMGEFKVSGDATYDFNFTNEKKNEVVKAVKVESLDGTVMSADPETVAAAERVNNWLESAIAIKDFEGYYDVYVKGYVMETLTHIKFEIDRHFTNKPVDAE